MRSLQQLAAEATDLGRPDAATGSVFVSCYSIGLWEITVHVHNEFALHHCDNPDAAVPTMTERGHDLDTVIDRMMRRVADAVADTPCEQVPA